MKKTIVALLVCFTLLLTACANHEISAAEPSAGAANSSTIDQGNDHQHVPTEMEADGNGHWYVCQCGEEVRSSHTLDENNFCQGCGSEVFHYEEGGCGVYTYDDYGTLICTTEYDDAGEVIFQQTASCEYYDDGNISFMQEYVNGTLTSESTYLPCEDASAGVYQDSVVYYYEDGSTETMTYDENFNLLSVVSTDENGEEIHTERYEYEFDENGNCVKQTGYVDGIMSQIFTYQYDETGTEIGSGQFYYDEEGILTDEYHFDAYGDEIGEEADTQEEA